MADTLPNVPTPPGVWVDLYAATGIIVGTQISIQNLGSNVLFLHAGPDVPTNSDGFKRLPSFREAINMDGDTGAWVLSKVVENIVNVAVVA